MTPDQIREAFKGIAASEGDIDLGEVLAELWEAEDHTFVNLDGAEVEAIAMRILTLNEIVSQNAIVALPTEDDE